MPPKTFRELLLEQVNGLPMYPSNNQSDTSIIAFRLCDRHDDKLRNLGILKGRALDNRFYPPSAVHNRVLRELNKMHQEGLVRKAYDYGGEGKGHNWTFIRWWNSGIRHTYPETKRKSDKQNADDL